MTSSSQQPRKSRPLRRKTSHSVIERRRREKINEGLIHLQDTVPACRQELKELLECKVKTNKKNAKKDQIELRAEVDELFREKSASEMVLEKLCIISHTVDYVQELQAKLEAYQRWCGSSPPGGSYAQLSRTHDGAHSQNQESVHATASEEGETSNCLDCDTTSTISKGKRHWGSNKPLHLSSKKTGPSIVVASRDDTQKSTSSLRQSPPKRKEVDSSSDISDFELDDWQSVKRLCAAQLYTNNDNRQPTLLHDRSQIGLGLLAQVSGETKRAG